MVYPERNAILLELFGNTPKLRLLNIFLENPYFDFTKEELVRELGMSKLTVYKYVRQMEKMGIIRMSRKIGKAVLFKLNRANPAVTLIEGFLRQFSAEIAENELKRKIAV